PPEVPNPGDADPCAAGACAGLGVVAAIGPGGFVNAWASRPHVPLRKIEALEAVVASGAAPDLGALGVTATAACAPSGLVPVARRGSDAGTTLAVFSGTIVVGRATSIELGLGAQGNVRVWVGKAKVLDVARDAATSPFVDEDVVKLALAAGPTPVVVVAEELGGPTSFELRARVAGGSSRVLAFAPSAVEGAACAPADLVDVSLTPHVVPGGFRVSVDATPRGLVPLRGVGSKLALDLLGVKRGGGREATLVASLDVPDAGVAREETIPLRREVSWLRVGPPGAPPTTMPPTTPEAGEVPLLYRREVHEGVARLVSRLGDVERSRAPAGTRATAAWLVTSVADALARGDGDVSWTERRAARAERLVDGVLAGADPLAEETGVVERAYRSRLDDSLQPYLVAVPAGHARGNKRYPMIVALHGMGGEPGQALRTVVGDAPERDKMNVPYEARHLPAIPTYDALLVAPTGYVNSGQRLPGEDDVLRVVEDVEEAYRVDASRVSITGYSLGGTTSFVVPLHYPDVFSSAAPLCGYPNFSDWQGVRGTPKTPWEEVLVARKSIVNYAENGEYLPLHIVHGGQDGPHRSQVMADRYHELHYRRVFDVQDDLDHDVWEYAYDKGRMIGWLRWQRRPAAPKHVRFVTGEPRYDRSYWVRVLGMTDEARFASVDATVDEGRVVVDAKNVAALALDLDAAHAPARGRLVVAGEDLGEIGAGTAWITFDGGRPARADEEPKRAGMKRRGVSGPLDDVQAHAAIVVYGTQIAAETESNRLAAEVAAGARSASLRFPIRADVDVTDADLASKSLILVGRPATNRVTASLIASLPVRFEPNAVTVRGVRYEGADVGVSLIYPNPRDTDEYVVLHAGVTAAGTRASRHLPALVPDYIVYDHRLTALRGALLLGATPVLAGGFFDAHWN
ncbi:MAG TPA: alpha/beta hydrolase-fold protein, partial [Byssovorax sp.]